MPNTTLTPRENDTWAGNWSINGQMTGRTDEMTNTPKLSVQVSEGLFVISGFGFGNNGQFVI